MSVDLDVVGDRKITVILAKNCIQLPGDGSLLIGNMMEQFQIFLNIL